MNSILTKIPPEVKPLILIRHAERNEITDMVRAMEFLLTERGKQDALTFGKELSELSPVVIYHSPVERCKETAEYLMEGILQNGGDARIFGYHLSLGGPYIKNNWLEISEEVKKTGHLPFLRKWFDGEYSENLIMPLKEVALLKLDLINEILDRNQPAIAVTHDWNIMILREFFFGLKNEDIGLPEYLDGIVAFRSGGKLNLVYHEHTVAVG